MANCSPMTRSAPHGWPLKTALVTMVGACSAVLFSAGIVGVGWVGTSATLSGWEHWRENRPPTAPRSGNVTVPIPR